MGKIDDELCEKLIKAIHEVNDYDDEQLEKEKNLVTKKHVRKPITVLINSHGGGVYPGFALINAMLDSKTPVDSYCSSVAFSMAACVFLAGAVRRVRPNSVVMFHSVISGHYGDLKEVKEWLGTMENVQSLITDWITARSKVKRREINALVDSRSCLYLGAPAAMASGVANQLHPY